MSLETNIPSVDPPWKTPLTLTPLKSILEVRSETSLIDFYAVKVPITLANTTLSQLRSFNDAGGIDIQHLRRFAKETDLPCHLKPTHVDSTEEGGYTNAATPSYLYLLVGPVNSIDLSELKLSLLATLQAAQTSDLTILTVKVPRLAPTSQDQALLWSRHHWPTIYKKSNPFGPHPSIVSRAETELKRDLHIWMSKATRIAEQSKAAGHGEAIGAIIVRRCDQDGEAIALAGDGRWMSQPCDSIGNVMAHAVIRVVDMVARKLTAAQPKGFDCQNANTTSSGMGHGPMLLEEQELFETENMSPDGYLCQGLEIYLTHEPCVMCSMALLHSRFARVVFGRRMYRTGGLCSEVDAQGGLGYGLFRRRELNWSFLAWEVEMREEGLESLRAVSSTIHA